MNVKDLGDQPAFPKADFINPNGLIEWGPFGMTYRQWLIGMVMQGLCSDETYDGDISINSIKIADGVLSALAKETEAKP